MKFFATSRLSENIAETPEGFLICLGVPIARVGEMDYADGETPIESGDDGRVVITRTSDEVFRKETIASFEGKPVTILHPSDFVSPENWSSLAKGIIQNVRQGKGENKDDLIADLLITDSVAISLVKNGLREVSCGYEAEYIQTDEGRGLQKNIIGNHLALVEEGRAGASYAINDHKGKGSTMTVKDKIKSIFGKAQDDALKLVAEATDAANVETPETKPGFVSLDDFQKGMKAIGDKIDALMKGGKDASTPPTESQPAEVVAKDEPGDAPGMEDRMKKLEMAVAKILEKMAPTGDDDGEEGELVGDDDGDDDETGDAESCGDDYGMVGDTASRVEILAPGMDAAQKGAKAKALIAAYATKDGKAVIDGFTGGKKPNFKDEKMVDTLFIGASEVLKTVRNSDLARTKTHDFQSNIGAVKGAMTPEKMNELNAKYWEGRTQH